MTNQQLKAHCEDVIANPQYHLEWVVDMARVALASLEAVPVGYIHKYVWREYKQAVCSGEDEHLVAYANASSHFAVFTAPPVPELKPIELPEMIYVREPGFIGYVYDANEIEEALKRNDIEVKSC